MKGLVLAGGYSTRMGTDKSLLHYHGVAQWQYCKNILEKANIESFISCRAEQTSSFLEAHLLIDPYQVGPLGGILSAFERYPDEPWLIIACDMPFVDEEAIGFLIQNRRPYQIATAFQNPESLSPEPLLTIWEPASYSLMAKAYQEGKRSPKNILEQAAINLLSCPHPQWLRNINTLAEYQNSF